MKRRRLVIISFIVVVACVIAISRYGRTWRIEWDLASGRQRSVSTILGIPLYGESEPTALSEWKRSKSGDVNWVEVAGGPLPPPRGIFVQYCYFNLLQMDLGTIRSVIMVSSINGSINVEEAQDAVATAVLDALRGGAEICEVLEMVRSVYDANRNFIESPVTLAELRALHAKQNKSALTNPLPL